MKIMSKNVKISLIGSKLLNAQYTEDLTSAVENMKNYLKSNIAQVLPDKPDLIILPEECDSFAGFNTRTE